MENKIKKYYGQYGQDSIIKQFFDHKNIQLFFFYISNNLYNYKNDLRCIMN